MPCSRFFPCSPPRASRVTLRITPLPAAGAIHRVCPEARIGGCGKCLRYWASRRGQHGRTKKRLGDAECSVRLRDRGCTVATSARPRRLKSSWSATVSILCEPALSLRSTPDETRMSRRYWRRWCPAVAAPHRMGTPSRAHWESNRCDGPPPPLRGNHDVSTVLLGDPQCDG